MVGSNGPERHSLRLCGIVMRIPRRRSVARNLRLLYPLSPTSRLGRRLGRPPVARWTAPWSSSASATVTSCCWPGVSTKVMMRPLPSTRTWSLVLNPPRLRPKASLSGLLFLPLPRAGARAQPCHRQSVLPNRLVPPGQLPAATRPGYGPITRPVSIGRSGWR